MRPCEKEALSTMGEHPFEINWHSLGEYLTFPLKKGYLQVLHLSVANPRVYMLGYANRAPNLTGDGWYEITLKGKLWKTVLWVSDQH